MPTSCYGNEAETQTDKVVVQEENVHHPLIFQEGGLIMSGGTYSLKDDQNIMFGLTEILEEGTGMVARGDLIISGSVERDIKIMAPIQKVKNTKALLSKKDRDHLAQFNLADNLTLQRQLADAPAALRKQVRMSQLGSVIRSEVYHSL